MRFFTIICFLFIMLKGQSQTINGTYKALELNNLQVDTFGNASFYGQNVFPKEKQFHEVETTIKGTKIIIEKSPVYFDNFKKCIRHQTAVF